MISYSSLEVTLALHRSVFTARCYASALYAVVVSSGVTEPLRALGHIDTLGPNLSWALAG